MATMTARLSISEFLLAFSLSAFAQKDSVAILRDSLNKAEKRIEAYEIRHNRYVKFWNSLIPNFTRLQFAGSVGLVNIGLGWEYGQKRQWETDLMFGLVPKYDSDDSKVTFTIRQTYIPWEKKLTRKGMTFQPLACGVFLNSVLNSDYWSHTPNRYPTANYYWFSSKIRLHMFIGQRYTLHIPKEKRFFMHSISVVWELSTCDLYIVSKAVNKSLPWKETLSLSLGTKINI